MAHSSPIRIRRSITELQDEYQRGNKKPLEDLMRAWKGIKDLPAEDTNSFFLIGGYHGEPFRGAGWGNSLYWGGYCNHGNALFPTWHRVYLLRLEDALRSIEGCEEVTLPYWDETSDDSVQNGIPWALTVETFELDGQTIPNPLRSFVLNRNIVDNINGDDPNYSKPLGYETVRYPLSGLVGTEADREATAAHNAQYSDYDQNVKLLNQNVVNWLGTHIVIDGKPVPTNVAKKFADCLNAPNYTVFSNTTSAAEWNENLPAGTRPVVPLESPHNSIHLAVGGYDVPSGSNAGDMSPIAGANGDMGENDTAGLDPIFFFHHCNVDRMFWVWQKKNGHTDHFDIIPEYPGTNTVDNQGPTPGMVPNTWLTLDSPMAPFKKKTEDGERFWTSRDCINIEQQMHYTYTKGSLDTYDVGHAPKTQKAEAPVGKIVKVSKVNRAPIRGSFLISAFVNIDGEKHHLGTEAVLSRWNVQYCANCQTHLEVKAFFEVPPSASQLHKALEAAPQEAVQIEIRGRDGVLTEDGEGGQLLRSKGRPPATYRLEVL